MSTWPPKKALCQDPKLRDRLRLTEQMHPDFCLYAIDEEHGVARSTEASRDKQPGKGVSDASSWKVKKKTPKEGDDEEGGRQDRNEENTKPECELVEPIRLFDQGLEQVAPPPSAEPELKTRPNLGKIAAAKPAWARTEEEEEEAHEEEVDELLDFAASLDIEQTMGDMEAHQLQEAIAAVEAQLAELGDDDDDAEAGSGDDSRSIGTAQTGLTGLSAKSRVLHDKALDKESADKDWDARTTASDESGMSKSSTMSRAVAQQMLEMNPNLRKVHTTSSLAARVEAIEESKKTVP